MLQTFELKFSRLTVCPVAHLGRGQKIAIHKEYKTLQFFFNLQRRLLCSSGYNSEGAVAKEDCHAAQI